MLEKGFSKPTDRIMRLKQMIVDAVPYVESDRAMLVTQSYKETEDLPMVMRRAKTLEKLMENLPVTIRNDELIVGSLTKRTRSVQIYPEFSYEWVQSEFETMGSRKADPFQIPQETAKELGEAFTYWKGKTIADLAMSYMSADTKACLANGVFAIGNYLNGGVGHVTVDYGKILKNGCIGVIAETMAAMSSMDKSDPDYIQKQQFYNAVIISYNAVITFAGRYAQKAREMAAAESDQVRKTELLKIAENCDRVPKNGATNFYEALQSFWFVQLITQIESNGHSISPGRFDQYIYPYLKNDSISKEAAQELIDCLWIKFNDLNKTRDEVSAQAFAGYQCFQNLCVGGQDEEGFDATNDISYMCMEATAHVRLTSPSFSIRVWQGTPDEFLLRACEVCRLGLGVPAMYNDEVIIPALVNRGVTLRDARTYSLIGCVEPTVPGKTEGWHDAAFFNIAKVLEITINNGKINGQQFGPVTGDVTTFAAMEQFYDAYTKQMNYFVNRLAEACNSMDYAHMERGKLPFLSAMVADCIGRGKCVQEGGAIYNFTGPQAIGVADVGDSVYAIRKNVFEDKKITMKQLKDALDANFGYPVDPTNVNPGKGSASSAVSADMTEAQLYEVVKQILSRNGSIDPAQLQAQIAGGSLGATAQVSGSFEDVRRMLDNTPTFGNDVDEVDLVARKCAQIYCLEVQRHKNPRNGIFQAGMYPVSSNVLFGKDVAALPDGRLAKTPLADGVSPRAGKDCSGPTAAANSVAKLDHHIASNGTLYNQKFLPSAVAGDTGLQNFAAVVRSYFDHKGMHVQFNVIDRETLLDAQKNPDNYKDLVVRVAGYSAQFVVLAKEVQDDIINRTAHAFS